MEETDKSKILPKPIGYELRRRRSTVMKLLSLLPCASSSSETSSDDDDEKPLNGFEWQNCETKEIETCSTNAEGSLAAEEQSTEPEIWTLFSDNRLEIAVAEALNFQSKDNAITLLTQSTDASMTTESITCDYKQIISIVSKSDTISPGTDATETILRDGKTTAMDASMIAESMGYDYKPTTSNFTESDTISLGRIVAETEACDYKPISESDTISPNRDAAGTEAYGCKPITSTFSESNTISLDRVVAETEACDYKPISKTDTISPGTDATEIILRDAKTTVMDASMIAESMEYDYKPTTSNFTESDTISLGRVVAETEACGCKPITSTFSESNTISLGRDTTKTVFLDMQNTIMPDTMHEIQQMHQLAVSDNMTEANTERRTSNERRFIWNPDAPSFVPSNLAHNHSTELRNHRLPPLYTIRTSDAPFTHATTPQQMHDLAFASCNQSMPGTASLIATTSDGSVYQMNQNMQPTGYGTSMPIDYNHISPYCNIMSSSSPVRQSMSGTSTATTAASGGFIYQTNENMQPTGYGTSMSIGYNHMSPYCNTTPFYTTAGQNMPVIATAATVASGGFIHQINQNMQPNGYGTSMPIGYNHISPYYHTMPLYVPVGQSMSDIATAATVASGGFIHQINQNMQPNGYGTSMPIGYNHISPYYHTMPLYVPVGQSMTGIATAATVASGGFIHQINQNMQPNEYGASMPISYNSMSSTSRNSYYNTMPDSITIGQTTSSIAIPITTAANN